MIWGGGARAKAGKKLNRYSRGEKTLPNNPEEKKNSTQQPGKNSSAGWPGKKLNTNSLPEAPPPDH